ncbi:MAG: hypothetical protein KDE14_12170 [Rhodobacteraceae bacterium]|nr:hypothetical protein [Paracoccaceae bacterium]
MVSMLKRPPFIGMFAFLLVLMLQGLGHTQMILQEKIFGEEWVFESAALMGVMGMALVYWGVRLNHNENAATWLGFLGGTYIWDGWGEFSFVYYARHLGVEHLVENGEIVTRAEYLVMPSSIGVLFATLVFFYFNRETRCNAFRWLHKHLHMPVGKPTLNYQRNISAIVAMETLYVIWFFYIFLLVIYDKQILGDDHWAMYPIFFGILTWSLYLLNRLRKYTRLPSAFRYGIPTAIITWNAVEIAGRWDMFTEIWIHPEQYTVHMIIVLAAFITVAVIFMLFPGADRPDELEPRSQPAE